LSNFFIRNSAVYQSWCCQYTANQTFGSQHSRCGRFALCTCYYCLCK